MENSRGIKIDNNLIAILRTFMLNDSKENTLAHIDDIIETLVLSGAIGQYNITDSMWVLFELKNVVKALDF